MGQVVPLKNIYCDLKRMQELQAIGLLIFRAEQLFASLRPTMSFAYRAEILKRANELIEEVNERRVYYFLSVGLSAPKDRLIPGNYKEC
jgi:hypothetical protein